MFTGLGLVTLLLGLIPASSTYAATTPSAPAAVSVPVDKGWTKFSWSPTVRGPLAFAVSMTSINPALLTLPSQVTFTASAKVKCPATGQAAVGVKVYDFNQLIFATTYTVNCAASSATTGSVAVKSADDYLNDVHYFHGNVSLATGGAHNLVIETDLATTDQLYWVYVRAETAPGVPTTDDIGSGAIALTAVNPPATAWVTVQWLEPASGQWHTVDSWTAPLQQADSGRMADWVEAKNYGTGPYRWVVYTRDPQQGGQVWGTSDPFNFPRQAGDWVWSQVSQTRQSAQ